MPQTQAQNFDWLLYFLSSKYVPFENQGQLRLANKAAWDGNKQALANLNIPNKAALELLAHTKDIFFSTTNPNLHLRLQFGKKDFFHIQHGTYGSESQRVELFQISLNLTNIVNLTPEELNQVNPLFEDVKTDVNKLGDLVIQRSVLEPTKINIYFHDKVINKKRITSDEFKTFMKHLTLYMYAVLTLQREKSRTNQKITYIYEELGGNSISGQPKWIGGAYNSSPPAGQVTIHGKKYKIYVAMGGQYMTVKQAEKHLSGASAKVRKTKKAALL